MDNDREAALAELAAALASLEGGGPPAPFLGGHGIQSRLFEFAWSDPALEIDFRLPWGLALDEEEPRRARDAEIGAAIRLALLLVLYRNIGVPKFVSLPAVWIETDLDAAAAAMVDMLGRVFLGETVRPVRLPCRFAPRLPKPEP